MMTGQEILNILKQEKNYLQREFGVISIGLFGSYVKGTQKPDSDVDLLVQFEPSASIGVFEFSRLRSELRGMPRCEVDLATPDALHKYLKEDILKEPIRAA